MENCVEEREGKHSKHNRSQDGNEVLLELRNRKLLDFLTPQHSVVEEVVMLYHK